MPVALITGITGQTGSYLAEHLINQGYTVHGIVRRSSTISTDRIDHIYKDPHEDTKLLLHYGDLSDASGIERIVMEVKPDEIYNLGAQSHVRVSFDQPIYTVDIVGTGTMRMLEAARRLNDEKMVKFYQASSSEMFGDAEPPQNEESPFRPRSPYACAKVMAHHMAVNYREAYGMFVCCGILFNHESPRRGETFVTRKITRAAARIKKGLQETLYLGNLSSRRDWGYAGDYVKAMHLMMQHHTPDDYVIATNETWSVNDFLSAVFAMAELDTDKHVEIDERYFRPTEVNVLLGDYSKAKNVLGWEPETTFQGLAKMMYESDLAALLR